MKIIKVCAAIIFDDDKVLLTNRPNCQTHAGYWEFPGGKVEQGETPAQCLKREIKEELNIDVMVFDTVYMLDYQYPDKNVSLRFMRCHIKNKQKLKALEQQQFAWVERKNLKDYCLLPADIDVAKFLAI